MKAEGYHLSDESKLEVAQHAYFQEMLGTVVAEVGGTKTLNIPPQGKGKTKKKGSMDLTLRCTKG